MAQLLAHLAPGATDWVDASARMKRFNEETPSSHPLSGGTNITHQTFF